MADERFKVLSELLDTFVREGGRGAAKLARHRESDHVGVKDMAYFLGTWFFRRDNDPCLMLRRPYIWDHRPGLQRPSV